MVSQKSMPITTVALVSRICIQLLQVANTLFPDHDAKVFSPPKEPTESLSGLDKTIDLLLGGFKRWDAVYFQHVAEYGYTYENTLAFFPLFPMLTRFIGWTIFLPLHMLMNYSSILLLSAFLLNNCLFIKSAQMLYELGVTVVKEESIAYMAALLFCFNPGSVFMSAPYSETIYCFLLLKTMQAIENESIVISSFYLGLCSVSRSNGLVAIGFIIHFIVKNYVKDMLIFLDTNSKNTSKVLSLAISCITLVKLLVAFVCSVVPFLIYQFYSYILFCKESVQLHLPKHISQYGREKGYHVVGDQPSSWCEQLLPLSYSYVQKHHWNVGFLNYYELKQLPNFILAGPVIVIGICCCLTYYKLNSKTVVGLGVIDLENVFKKKYDDVKTDFGFKNNRLFIYCAHLLFLLTFGIFFIHIQVLTRLIFSSCPVVYWYLAYLTTNELKPTETINKYDMFAYKAQLKRSPKQESSGNLLRQVCDLSKNNIYFRLTALYFLLYFIFGTVAFSNFLPFT